jgi:hypothetical protein
MARDCICCSLAVEAPYYQSGMAVYAVCLKISVSEINVHVLKMHFILTWTAFTPERIFILRNIIHP